MEAFRILRFHAPYLGVCLLLVAVALPVLIRISARSKRRWLRDLGSPLGLAVIGGASLLGVLLSLVALYADFLSTWFVVVDGARLFNAPADQAATLIAPTLSSAMQLQAAGCFLGLMFGLGAVGSAWWRMRETPGSQRIVGTLVAAALAVPVIAGGLVGCWLIGELNSRGTNIGEVWHGAETARWILLCMSVCALMAATPIVVAASQRGVVVQPRVYTASQALLGVAVLIWSGSQLLAEDTKQGPLSTWERALTARPVGGPGMTESGALVAFETNLPVLPCAESPAYPLRGIEIELVVDTQHEVIDASGDELSVDAWTNTALRTIEQARELQPTAAGPIIVFALIDRRAAAYRLAPYFQAVRALPGDVRLVIVSASFERRSSIASGTFVRTRTCATAVLRADETEYIDSARLQWGTIATAASEAQRQRQRPH